MLTWAALTDGMFSENWRAVRTRTGPRSRLSASAGVYLPPKSVEVSMNIEPAVICLSSMPVR